MSSVNTGVSMKVSFIGKDYVSDVYKSMTYYHYGLAAGVWTVCLRRAITVSEGLEAGTTWVNTYRSTDYTMPFGGYKVRRLGRSGAWEGRTGSRRSRLDYLQTKSVWYHAGGDVANPYVRR